MAGYFWKPDQMEVCPKVHQAPTVDSATKNIRLKLRQQVGPNKICLRLRLQYNYNNI